MKALAELLKGSVATERFKEQTGPAIQGTAAEFRYQAPVQCELSVSIDSQPGGYKQGGPRAEGASPPCGALKGSSREQRTEILSPGGW
jgi:hypothetical protein